MGAGSDSTLTPSVVDQQESTGSPDALSKKTGKRRLLLWHTLHWRCFLYCPLIHSVSRVMNHPISQLMAPSSSQLAACHLRLQEVCLTTACWVASALYCVPGNRDTEGCVGCVSWCIFSLLLLSSSQFRLGMSLYALSFTVDMRLHFTHSFWQCVTA